MKKKGNKYTSHDIQNELIKVMATQILRNVISSLQQSPFLALMMDESTDVSNVEQVTYVIRWVDDKLEVHEEFVGLYSVPSIDSDTLMAVTKDVFLRMNMSFTKLRGQCYDGASVMKGSKSGIAVRICKEEPRAIYTHCYGHSINLAASDAIRSSKIMKDALDITFEITKLIKYSPRREAVFREVKESHDFSTGSHSAGIRILCPTRWTVRADALKSITNNYQTLQSTCEESVEITKDSEVKARLIGVSTQMKRFDFLFGVFLGEMLLQHTDNLSKSLQKETISAAEAQQLGRMVIDTLRRVREEEAFILFWDRVVKFAKSVDVDEPHLPRQRKTPKRYDSGTSSGSFPTTAQQYFRQCYYEAVDNITGCLEDRYNQPGYSIYCNLEQLLLKACQNLDYKQELEYVCSFYKDDLEEDRLRVQLLTFQVDFMKRQISESQPSNLSIFDVRKYFQALSPSEQGLLDQVYQVLRLVLVMPATNSSSERSFSALRRVKSYLRSTMTQQRLNNLMILHVYKEQTDGLILKDVANEFVGNSQHRKNIFGKF